MTQLTQHFSRAEFERSDIAARYGIDNTVPEALMPNLQRVAELLEKIRNHVGTIIVTSGYRCPALNPKAGGATNSAHMAARAADIHVDGITPGALATYIRDSGITFDKVLEEYGSWVHVQVARVGETPRQQVFMVRIVNGEKVYKPGLVWT